MALAHSIESPVTLPPWDNSAMDGYAVQGDSLSGASRETSRTLRVTGALHAGEVGGHAVGAGEAVRIMTGTPVPAGADCVVRVEDTDAEREPGRVAVFSERDRGRNVRPAGQDMRAGETVLPRGTTLGAGQTGVLAACGLTHGGGAQAARGGGARQRRRDRPGGSGSPKWRPGAPSPDTNGPMLAAAVREAGGEGGAAGDRARHRRERARAPVAGCRAGRTSLLTIGGASMGRGGPLQARARPTRVRARLLARAHPPGQSVRLRAPARGGAGAGSRVRAAGESGVGFRHLPPLRPAPSSALSRGTATPSLPCSGRVPGNPWGARRGWRSTRGCACGLPRAVDGAPCSRAIRVRRWSHRPAERTGLP